MIVQKHLSVLAFLGGTCSWRRSGFGGCRCCHMEDHLLWLEDQGQHGYGCYQGYALCNETNPIFELYAFFWSFYISYCLFLCYHVTVRLMSGSLNSHHTPEHMTKSSLTWLSVSLHDSQSHHMTVSLTPYLPFTLLATHTCLLHYYSALPLTFTPTPWHPLTFSLVGHLYLSTFSLYYNSLLHLTFPLHDGLSYQTTFATVLTTFITLLRPLYFNYAYHLYYSSVQLVSYL